MRLVGFDAIEYAERECLTLNKKADRIDDQALGLTVAEAEAIAVEEPDLIWLDVPDDEYYGAQHSLEPGTEPSGIKQRAGQRRDELSPGEEGRMSGDARRSKEATASETSFDDSGDNSADTVIDLGQSDGSDLDGFEIPAGESLSREPQSGPAGGAVGGTPAGKRVTPK